ncbi:hypothetical protein YC2023_115167 [Brassica napus]
MSLCSAGIHDLCIVWPNTQQSIIDFQLQSIIDNQGNFSDSTIENMEFMLTYNDIHHLDLTFIIQETNQFVMNLLRENNNMIANDLQVTLNIKDYYQNAIVRLDVDLIITYLKGINRPPTKEEEKDSLNTNHLHLPHLITLILDKSITKIRYANINTYQLNSVSYTNQIKLCEFSLTFIPIIVNPEKTNVNNKRQNTKNKTTQCINNVSGPVLTRGPCP